jgi:hypothetical protein
MGFLLERIARPQPAGLRCAQNITGKKHRRGNPPGLLFLAEVVQ